MDERKIRGKYLCRSYHNVLASIRKGCVFVASSTLSSVLYPVYYLHKFLAEVMFSYSKSDGWIFVKFGELVDYEPLRLFRLIFGK